MPWMPWPQAGIGSVVSSFGGGTKRNLPDPREKLSCCTGRAQVSAQAPLPPPQAAGGSGASLVWKEMGEPAELPKSPNSGQEWVSALSKHRCQMKLKDLLSLKDYFFLSLHGNKLVSEQTCNPLTNTRTAESVEVWALPTALTSTARSSPKHVDLHENILHRGK